MRRALIVLAAMVVAACSGERATRQDPSRIEARTGKYGAYLTDANGRALYAFSGDAAGQTACLTHCATVWPPVIVEKLPEAAAGVDRARLAIVARPDSTGQLAYYGMPLYYSESDLQPGAVWGHSAMSFGGRFALVSPAGKTVPPP